MGIDVYMRWKNQTEQEKEAQYTGFSIEHGHVGYLREAYHGAPYATVILVPEAFEQPAAIDASVLRQRLPEALQVVYHRHHKLYPRDSEDAVNRAQKAFSDFVDLAEKKQEETGTPVTIEVSA